MSRGGGSQRGSSRSEADAGPLYDSVIAAGASHALAAGLFSEHVAVMREMLGPARFEAALAELPEAQAELVRIRPQLGWIEFETVESVVTAMAAQAGRPIEEFQREVVHRGLRERLSTIWRVLIRFTSRRALVKRAATFFRKSWSRGEATYVSPHPGRILVELRDVPSGSDYAIRGVVYGIEAISEVARGVPAKVTWARHPDGADLVIKWDPGA